MFHHFTQHWSMFCEDYRVDRVSIRDADAIAEDVFGMRHRLLSNWLSNYPITAEMTLGCGKTSMALKKALCRVHRRYACLVSFLLLPVEFRAGNI
jgi:hypothetical protein